jgi:hypothetical protein
LTILDPDGKELYRVYRATGGKKEYREAFPLGSNAPAGKYTVRAESPVGGLRSEVMYEVKADRKSGFQVAKGLVVAEHTDLEALGAFLRSKPSLTIAFAEGQKEAAERLARELTARGLKAMVQPASEVIRKVAYPRVWNPFATVYSPGKDEKKAPGPVKNTIQLGTNAEGRLTATTADKKDVSGDWRLPESVVTITGEGYVDWSGDQEICYEPGVQLYVNDKRQVQVFQGTKREEQTTPAFRKKWARPWTRLTTHVGGYQLPAQLPEAFTTDSHLILLGDSSSSEVVAALQASELLERVVDAKYPGPGKALLAMVWSPFAVEKNAIFVGAADAEGLNAGIDRLLGLMSEKKK